MRNWILLLGVMGFLAACAPQISADPGEVVYEVPVASSLGTQTAIAAGDPVVTRLAQELVVFYTLEARPPVGYGRWTQTQGQGSTIIYISEKRDAQNNVSGKVEMRWTLSRRADGFGSVRLETLATEQVDVAAIERAAFSRLDRTYKRVAGSR